MSVGTRSGAHKQGYQTTDTTGHTSHHCMDICVDVASGIRVEYLASEWLANPLPSGVLLIDAALVMPVTHTVIPFTFRGQNTLRLDSSTGLVTPWVRSDPLPVDLFRGANKPYVRTWVRSEAGAAVPVGCDWYSDTADLQWYQTGNHLLDSWASAPAAPGAAYSNTYYFTPSALLADRVVNASADWVFALYGDSNMANADQDSYEERGIAKGYAMRRLCAAGSAAGAMTKEKSPLGSLLEGCDTLIYAMSTNNYSQNYNASLKPAIQAELAFARRRGIKRIIGCTGPPSTDSSNGWVDVAGQAPTAINDATRTALNADYRAGGVYDFDCVCDATTAVEVASNGILTVGGKLWKPTYGDNVHYQANGKAAAAPVMATTISRLIAGERGFVQQATTLGT